MVTRRVIMLLMAASLILVPLLGGCATTATPTTAPTAAQATATKAATTVAPTKAAASTTAPTAVPPTATAATPKVGGTLVVATTIQLNTLDPIHGANFFGFDWVGGQLVTVDAKGQIVPYLAESWTISDDGLVYDFSLKKGVKFHDGSPLTAEDWAYTINKVNDPEANPGLVAMCFGAVVKAEAVDDYHLRLTVAEPNYPFLFGLSYSSAQPVPSDSYEKLGDSFARSPVLSGPYKVKEFRTDEKVVLERNADYNWGPAFDHKGPYYIQNVELRYIAEYATQIAGLESGDVSVVPFVQSVDIGRLSQDKGVKLNTSYYIGIWPGVFRNVSRAPFNDLKVRQAFNYAVDAKAVIDTVMSGYAIPQTGPLSKGTVGYWAGIEDLAYGYDLAKAKQLLMEAGYTMGTGGIWEKDGKPLKVTMIYALIADFWGKLAQVLQQQWKALGVDISIQQVEGGVLDEVIASGDFDLAINGADLGEADVMYYIFHSSNSGYTNYQHLDDPEMDRLVELTRTTTDPARRQEAVNAAAKYSVEQAYVLPIFTVERYQAVSSRVKGVKATLVNDLNVADAYFVD